MSLAKDILMDIFEWRDFGAPNNSIEHNIPKSLYEYSPVEKHWQDDDTKFKKQIVPIDRIRSTQGWINPKWKPSKDIGQAHGVRTSDGLIHISDGHHRVNKAQKSGAKDFEMYVKDVGEKP